MGLYLITPPQTGPDEISLISYFLGNSLQRLHVRKPAYPDADYRKYILAIPPRFHAKLVLHGAYGLLQEFPSLGIHLGGRARHDEAIVQQVKQLRPATLSGSFHAWEEIMENTISFDYVFISPVFDSISKQGYKAGIELAGHARLQQWASARQKRLPPVVALGGVTADAIPVLRQHGFAGAALLGAVWESADPVAAFDEIRRINSSPAGF